MAAVAVKQIFGVARSFPLAFADNSKHKQLETIWNLQETK